MQSIICAASIDKTSPDTFGKTLHANVFKHATKSTNLLMALPLPLLTEPFDRQYNCQALTAASICTVTLANAADCCKKHSRFIVA